MKRIIACFLCVALLAAALAISAGAGAVNAAGGCKINNTIMKTDPARVQKDGVIGVGEYTEIEIDRDISTSDVMLSYLSLTGRPNAQALLSNVHFYMSWDEVHGLNVAAVAELVETPKNENVWPPENLSTDDTGFSYPGDDFLCQFGLMFKTFVTDEMTNKNTKFYRAFSKNTATGELQYGYYNQNGYTGNWQMTPYEDYIVTINDKVVTYEFSCPLADFLPESDLSNGLPVEGAMIRYALSATGGSEGAYWDGAKTYAVSLGDYGYMTSWSQWKKGASHAHGTFTSEMIPGTSCDHTDTTNVDAVPATCKSTGFTAGVYCNDCKTYISGHEEVPISSTNHVNTTNVDAVPATCQSTGFTAGVYCNDCETYISGHEEVPISSTNHVYGEWTKYDSNQHKRVCPCGDVQYEDHNWGMGDITEQPTCTEPGAGTVMCGFCGEITNIVPPLGHDYSEEWTVDKAATATERGIKSRHCSRCDSVTDVTEYVDSSLIFDDVKANKWYTPAIDYSVLNGLMNGVSSTRFDLNGTTTRAMVVTILYRLEGSPDVSGQVPFTDIKSDWYKDAVLWAYNNDIVKGISATKFDPNAPVTREQIATILYRYAEFKGYDTTARADYSELPDANKTHTWAKEALQWAYAEGLITGTSNNGAVILDPRGNATRAQVATIVMRFLENR